MDSVFDAELFRLGNLCKRGHDWNGSGQSLRRIKGSTCQECNRQRKRQHYTKNREQYLTRGRERYKRKRESILKYAHEYREKNLESIRQRDRNYRLANLDKIRQQNREYQKVNREKRNDYQRCYRQTEKGYQVKNAANRKHKAAKRNNHNASYTSAQILELHSQFGCCAYCGVESNGVYTSIMSKPLPVSVLSPSKKKVDAHGAATEGIILGEKVIWNPANLPNGHVVLIGASGSGKTQSLKAIAFEIPKLFPQVRVILIDFHGDLQLPSETCYPLNMESPHGINPLTIDLDTKGGGPALQAIAVAAILKKALTMGANQEGLMIDILTGCYQTKGITQDNPSTWTKTPPTFADVEQEIEARIEDGCKESSKLALKLAATFQYGIFARKQPPLDAPIIRFDLSALGKVPGLGAIAAESLVKQLMDAHRLKGEIQDKSPRTYIFIDEAKEVKGSRSVDLVLADGRKYGLNAVLASQRDAHISDNAIANSATKIVLAVDQTEVARVAKRFRFADRIVAELQPLEALVRMGTLAHKCRIQPYYERVTE